jgi:hypothetical protein
MQRAIAESCLIYSGKRPAVLLAVCVLSFQSHPASGPHRVLTATHGSRRWVTNVEGARLRRITSVMQQLLATTLPTLSSRRID